MTTISVLQTVATVFKDVFTQASAVMTMMLVQQTVVIHKQDVSTQPLLAVTTTVVLLIPVIPSKVVSIPMSKTALLV